MEPIGNQNLLDLSRLPQGFVSRLITYLSPEEKGNLAETNSTWARRIIQVDQGLQPMLANEQRMWTLVRAHLIRWGKSAEEMQKGANPWVAEQLKSVVAVCHNMNQAGVKAPPDTVIAIVDTANRIQAVAFVVMEKTHRKMELLVTNPDNFLRTTQRTRGAGTLAVATALSLSKGPLVLTPLDPATPFYRRCGFVALKGMYQTRFFSTDILTNETARKRLGHLNIKWLDPRD